MSFSDCWPLIHNHIDMHIFSLLITGQGEHSHTVVYLEKENNPMKGLRYMCYKSDTACAARAAKGEPKSECVVTK